MMPDLPPYFEDLLAKPGQGICLRIINRIRFRVAMYRFYRWMFDDDGNLTDEFRSLLCEADCNPTTTTTSTTTAP
jgi:hypothetical protein